MPAATWLVVPIAASRAALSFVKLQPRLIRFGFVDLLHAADIDAHFPGGFDHVVEQIADHLVAVGGDADVLPARTSAQIMRAPVYVLPAPGGP